MTDKITINLELVGKRYAMQCAAEDEPLYREAAALIKDEYQKLVNRFGNNTTVKEADLIAFTLLHLALNLRRFDKEQTTVSERMKSLDADLSSFLRQHK